MSCEVTKPTKFMQSVKTQIRLCINQNEALPTLKKIKLNPSLNTHLIGFFNP